MTLMVSDSICGELELGRLSRDTTLGLQSKKSKISVAADIGNN